MLRACIATGVRIDEHTDFLHYWQILVFLNDQPLHKNFEDHRAGLAS